MLRSPGSSRLARPFIPEEAELKLGLLGVEAEWHHSLRAFLVALPGHAESIATLAYSDITRRGWDAVLSDLADKLVKARVPAGHTSGLSRIAPVVVEAASVIDENFK